MKRMLASALLPLLLAGVVGCATQTVDGGEMAAVAPMLSVERFLQASNSRDLDAMARIFGTADGPIGDRGSTVGCAFKKMGSWIGLSDACLSREEVELRMNAIAEILQHRDYRVVTESNVAGRTAPTRRVGVDLTFDDTTLQEVPFVVVRASGGRWLVEQVDLVRITQR